LDLMRALLPVLLLLLAPWTSAQAAVGCSLRDPDADIRRFFPTMTDYSIHYLTYANQAPERYPELSTALGDALDPVYETIDMPYTLYVVNGGRERLGYVFGTNQRGKYSNIQVIAILDARIDLQQVYIQKIRSPAFEAFQSDDFGTAMATVELSDYPAQVGCYRDGDCADFPVADPSGGAHSEDFRAIIRGLAKLQILSDMLLQPGQSPVPRDDRARSEWIGNAGGAEPSRQVYTSPTFAAPAEAGLSPDEPVVLWQKDGWSRIFPIRVLSHTPVVRLEQGGESYLLAWSDSSGTAAIFQTDQELQMTSDLLFGVRLLSDPATGSRVSPVLGSTVYGEAEIVLSMEPGVRLMQASQAISATPDAQVLQLPEHVISAPNPVFPVGEQVIVVRDGSRVQAWTLAYMEHEEVDISEDRVQFWMTLEGFKSTFPYSEFE
jgi:hypothetical protein